MSENVIMSFLFWMVEMNIAKAGKIPLTYSTCTLGCVFSNRSITSSIILPLYGLGTFQLLPANTPIVKTMGFCV